MSHGCKSAGGSACFLCKKKCDEWDARVRQLSEGQRKKRKFLSKASTKDLSKAVFENHTCDGLVQGRQLLHQGLRSNCKCALPTSEYKEHNRTRC